jgi:hypothetical protein
MGMIDEWAALSARISALAETARLQAAFLAINKSDGYASSTVLRNEAGAILAEALNFSSRFEASLSVKAREAIGRAKPQSKPSGKHVIAIEGKRT